MRRDPQPRFWPIPNPIAFCYVKLPLDRCLDKRMQEAKKRGLSLYSRLLTSVFKIFIWYLWALIEKTHNNSQNGRQQEILEFKFYVGRGFVCVSPCTLVPRTPPGRIQLKLNKRTSLKAVCRPAPYSSQNPSVVQHTRCDACHLPPPPALSILPDPPSLGGNGIIIPDEAGRSMNPKLWRWASIIALNSGPVSRRVN